MDNLGLLSSLHFPNVLLPCSPLMYSALMMASLYGCRCFMCKKNGLKRSMTNNSEAPSSDFSLSKCRRLDHESSLIAPINDTNGSHKCAGTQTLFSSFVPAHNFYPQPPHDSSLHNITNEDEPRFILDLDHHMARSSQVHPNDLLGGMQQPTSPPLETESSNAPLNLTLSPSSKSNLRSHPVGGDVNTGGWSSTRDQSYILPDEQTGNRMPSWNSEELNYNRNGGSGGKLQKFDKYGRPQTQHKIWALTNDARTNVKNNNNINNNNNNNKPQSNSPCKVSSVVTVQCEKDIEEHFQRSLGKDYPKCFSKNKHNISVSSRNEPVLSAPEPSSYVNNIRNGKIQTPPTNDGSLEGSNVNVTISGAVDDHFAKSLGQTWIKLKSQNSQTDFKVPPPGSVDDHFAKALGETWYKLRVKKEGT